MYRLSHCAIYVMCFREHYSATSLPTIAQNLMGKTAKVERVINYGNSRKSVAGAILRDIFGKYFLFLGKISKFYSFSLIICHFRMLRWDVVRRNCARPHCGYFSAETMGNTGMNEVIHVAITMPRHEGQQGHSMILRDLEDVYFWGGSEDGPRLGGRGDMGDDYPKCEG